MARSIAGLAKAGGVGVETVRYYQRLGLLRTPDKGGPGGGMRRYDEGDVRRLRFIRSAQAAGFTLNEIGELLALDASDDRPRILALATRRLAALDGQIETLQRARSALARLAEQCGAGGRGPCPIVGAFEGDGAEA